MLTFITIHSLMAKVDSVSFHLVLLVVLITIFIYLQFKPKAAKLKTGIKSGFDSGAEKFKSGIESATGNLKSRYEKSGWVFLYELCG